jgi:hypothetical protein
MASALQCPTCGFKHRLSALSGEPIFECAQCGRLLKTPTEYLRPEPSGPSAPPRPSSKARVERGGSATRDQTSVMSTGAAAGAAAAGGAPPRPKRPVVRKPETIALPLRILAWVVAVALGAVIVRYLAKLTGFLTGDSLIDVITGSGIGRYLRLFALAPVWALATAGLVTLFVEAGKWWIAHRGVGTPARKPPVKRPQGSRPPAQDPRQDPRPAAKKPRPPGSQPRPAPVPNPAAAETRSPAGAAGAQKARRIPKRDVPS